MRLTNSTGLHAPVGAEAIVKGYRKVKSRDYLTVEWVDRERFPSPLEEEGTPHKQCDGEYDENTFELVITPKQPGDVFKFRPTHGETVPRCGVVMVPYYLGRLDPKTCQAVVFSADDPDWLGAVIIHVDHWEVECISGGREPGDVVKISTIVEGVIIDPESVKLIDTTKDVPPEYYLICTDGGWVGFLAKQTVDALEKV